MAATITSMNDALHRIDQSSLSEQLYQGNPWLEKLESGARYKIGEKYRVSLHTRRSGSTTFLPDGGGNLNAAQNQGIKKAEYVYKHMHQQIAIQEDVLEETANSSLAAAEALDTEVTGALNDLRKQITRTLFGNGDGIICGVRTATSTTIGLELLDGYNAVQRGWLFGDADGGSLVDVGTAGSQASIIAGEQVLAVSESVTAPSITVTSSAAVTAGTHFVSLKGARSGATSYEPNGLRNIVSQTAVLGGTDPATVTQWKSANTDTTSQPLTLSLLLQQDQAISQKSNGGESKDYLFGLKQERKFYEQLQQSVRYGSDADIDAGGSDKATWRGRKIWAHPDCPNEDAYVLDMKHLFILASRKPFWQNAITGGNILSHIQGTASYGAKLGYHFQLGTDKRLAFARLGGLT